MTIACRLSPGISILTPSKKVRNTCRTRAVSPTGGVISAPPLVHPRSVSLQVTAQGLGDPECARLVVVDVQGEAPDEEGGLTHRFFAGVTLARGSALDRCDWQAAVRHGVEFTPRLDLADARAVDVSGVGAGVPGDLLVAENEAARHARPSHFFADEFREVAAEAEPAHTGALVPLGREVPGAGGQALAGRTQHGPAAMQPRLHPDVDHHFPLRATRPLSLCSSYPGIKSPSYPQMKCFVAPQSRHTPSIVRVPCGVSSSQWCAWSRGPRPTVCIHSYPPARVLVIAISPGDGAVRAVPSPPPAVERSPPPVAGPHASAPRARTWISDGGSASALRQPATPPRVPAAAGRPRTAAACGSLPRPTRSFRSGVGGHGSLSSPR